MFALDGTTTRTGPAATPTPSLPTPESTEPQTEGSGGLCTDKNVNRLDAMQWPAVITVQDVYGISTIRRSPTESHLLAYCTTEWGVGAKKSVVTGGERGGIMLRRSVATRQGRTEPSSVTTVLGNVPHGVERITVETSDGHVGVATIEGPYFAYRRIEQTPRPGPQPTAVIRFKYRGKAELGVVRR